MSMVKNYGGRGAMVGAALAPTVVAQSAAITALQADDDDTIFGPWKHDNIADSLTNNNTPGIAISGATHKRWRVDVACTLVGMAAHLNSAVGSAGSVTFSIFKASPSSGAASDAGADYDLVITPGSAPGEFGGQVVFATPLALAAGDSVEIRTTTSGWDHTAADAVIFLRAVIPT